MSETESGQANYLIKNVKIFIEDPFKRLDYLEDEFSDLYKETRRPAYREMPPVTIEDIDNMVSRDEISEISNKEKFTQLLQAIRITGTEIQLLRGSGSIIVFDDKGQMSRFFVKGPILEKKGEDGELDYPGGLWDYAINKAMTARLLDEVGSDSTMIDPEDAEYVKQLAKVSGAHMGSACYIAPDGKKYFSGGSGIEMTDEGLTEMIDKLPKGSTDGEYTIAGIIDGLVSKWACRFVAGEEVSVTEAQKDVDEIIRNLPIFPKPYSDYHLVESILKKLPPHVH